LRSTLWIANQFRPAPVRAAEYAAAGITELFYQPAGPDIVGELARMIGAIGDVTDAASAPTG
jgi:hypothetical protein